MAIFLNIKNAPKQSRFENPTANGWIGLRTLLRDFPQGLKAIGPVNILDPKDRMHSQLRGVPMQTAKKQLAPVSKLMRLEQPNDLGQESNHSRLYHCPEELDAWEGKASK
jgi:hypothetical protein